MFHLLYRFQGLMPMMKKSLEEYAENGGWSSKLFAENAVPLMKELMDSGVNLKVGRHVIHLEANGKKIKAYVHHNGRTPEYATLTDHRGQELDSFHYTEFPKLELRVRTELGLTK